MPGMEQMMSAMMQQMNQPGMKAGGKQIWGISCRYQLNQLIRLLGVSENVALHPHKNDRFKLAETAHVMGKFVNTVTNFATSNSNIIFSQVSPPKSYRNQGITLRYSNIAMEKSAIYR